MGLSLNTQTGTVNLPAWNMALSGKTTKEEFFNSTVGAKCSVIRDPAGVTAATLPEYDRGDDSWHILLLFVKQRLTGIRLSSGRFPNDPSSQSSSAIEIARRQFHDEWLKGQNLTVGDYPWGFLKSVDASHGPHAAILVNFEKDTRKLTHED